MAFRQLLIPFDTSPLAQAAESIGAWLAWRGNGELDLVRAVPHVHALFATRPVPGMAHLEAQEDAADLARATSDLAIEAARLRETGVRATGTAYPGEPASVLLDYITSRPIDLVVMGTHGRPLAERWLLGSVAHDVTRSSPAPVLLVPADGRFHRDDELHVLVAYDGSAPADGALEAATSLAETVPVVLTLVQVLPGDGPDPTTTPLSWYEEPVLGAPPDLDTAASILARRGEACQRAYAFGAPAEQILTLATRGNYDLIALGTHSRDGIDRLVMGSVADAVVRRASVPVLIANRKLAPVTAPPSATSHRVAS